MDLQGTPIQPGSRSTKVTTDPRRYQQPREEPSGPITNDSLAAESIRQGGGFSSNRGAQPMGASSDNSTVNNTDTSASKKLDPTSVRGYREDRQKADKFPEEVVGQGNFPGTHSDTSGYAGGSTAAKQQMGLKAGEYSSAASGSGHSQNNAGQTQSAGGFEGGDAKNASFTEELGSSEDPSREAINQMQRHNAGTAHNAGRYDQKGVSAERTVYDHLESEQRA
ncbi:uncharacterized protein N7515_004792 [Penicillium bovifimosum]|uniref:Uncharacterized protein n=1 Tax=Penicillium bovifimosum TaxID=126998 RepID=A0A9W9H0T5_9EURO|nr:uncharacterized protein N7515_004792 [Penicillium bovifimosum]KAJ5135514.1 hypothetical protein N7515_004792 [Penicillium bovifimosum]